MRHMGLLLVALLCCGGLHHSEARASAADMARPIPSSGERPLLVERIRPERPHWDNHYGGDRRRPYWNHRRDYRRHPRPPYGYAPPPPSPYYGAPYGYVPVPPAPGYPFGYDPRNPRPDYPFGYDPRGRAPRHDSPYRDDPWDDGRYRRGNRPGPHHGGGWI